MVLVVHLGVVDVPYGFEPKENNPKPVRPRIAKGKGKDKAPRTGAGNGSQKTTGDVAEILEDQYLVMEWFWEKYGDRIVVLMEDDLAKTAQDMMDGFPVSTEPFAEAMAEAERLFREFLTSSEMEEILGAGPGTAAARKGVNHRLRHPYAKGNPPRPPFIDTGLYQASFRAWVEGRWSR